MPRLTAVEGLLLALPFLAAVTATVLGIAVYRGRIKPPAGWTPTGDDAPPPGPGFDDIWAAFRAAERSGDRG